MSALTFKVGDRVKHLPSRRAGTVTDTHDGWIRIAGGAWSMWVDPAGCVACPPMSPQARMVWHAMRAGAFRTNGHVVFGNQRKRQYGTQDGCISLTIYTDLPAGEVQS